MDPFAIAAALSLGLPVLLITAAKIAKTAVVITAPLVAMLSPIPPTIAAAPAVLTAPIGHAVVTPVVSQLDLGGQHE